MNKTIGVIVLFAIAIGQFACIAPKVDANASSPLLITAIQTGGSTSASEEYIELANLSATPLDITGWRLEYFSANPKSFTTPSRTISLSGTIAVKDTYLLASTGFESDTSRQSFSATLASAGGHLRLRNSSITEDKDLVGWGTAVQPLGQPALAPPAGQMLRRIKTTTGYKNTANNAQDFAIDQAITATNMIQESNSESVKITEILPNPASPVTDADGEFVELFNNGNSTVQLKGFVLKVGLTQSKSYTFTDQSLAPGEYKAFYITQTKLNLSNSGGKVVLYSPTGTLLDQTEQYLTAPAGQSWAFDGTKWLWTTAQTPDLANSFLLPTPVVKASSTKTTKNKSATKKSTKTRKKLASADPKTTTKDTINTTAPSTQQAPLHNAVLAVVASLAVLYGAYEYRQDIASTIRKFRRDRTDRP